MSRRSGSCWRSVGLSQGGEPRRASNKARPVAMAGVGQAWLVAMRSLEAERLVARTREDLARQEWSRTGLSRRRGSTRTRRRMGSNRIVTRARRWNAGVLDMACRHEGSEPEHAPKWAVNLANGVAGSWRPRRDEWKMRRHGRTSARGGATPLPPDLDRRQGSDHPPSAGARPSSGPLPRPARTGP